MAVSKKSIAEAFTRAKKYVWDGRVVWNHSKKERHICLALEMAYDNGELSWAQFSAARDVIEDRIAPAFAIEEWLMINGHASLTDVENNQRVQEFRKDWLDALISEYTK